MTRRKVAERKVLDADPAALGDVPADDATAVSTHDDSDAAAQGLTPIKRRRRNVSILEERIGYRFANPKLIDCALTHVSAHSVKRGKATASEGSKGENYQRLEFLGDRVLGLVISDALYRTFPKAAEGELSRRLADLVRKETCADVARMIDLGAAIRLGTSEASAGARLRIAILADVCEALIGAIFLDGGLPAATDFIARFWGERMHVHGGARRDPKTALQEWAQARGLPTPLYSEVERTGPHHDPEFKVRAELPGLAPADGVGRSKREAEKAAAAAFLAREGVLV